MNDKIEKPSRQLRKALVRDLVRQNRDQLGSKTPVKRRTRPRPERLEMPTAMAPETAPEKKHPWAHRFRIPLLLVAVVYLFVFGTSAFRSQRVSLEHRLAKPDADVWNPELLDELRKLTSSEHLPMPLARMFQLKAKRIVLDPGHGGIDSGTKSKSGLIEKDLTLAIVQALAPKLEKKLSCEIIFTRETDDFVSLRARVEMANRLEADLFLSVHLNWFPSPRIQRVETYFVGLSKDRESLELASRENASGQFRLANFDELLIKMTRTLKLEESKRFAHELQSSLQRSLKKRNPKLRDRGVRRAPFVVLMGAEMPAVLAEVSFLSNEKEAKRLESEDYIDLIAESLTLGIGTYLHAQEKAVQTASGD